MTILERLLKGMTRRADESEKHEREFRYGDENTIHDTSKVDVEVCRGTVVSVWYRCRLLPFTVTKVGGRRAYEMNRDYRSRDLQGIKAIIFDTSQED